MTIYWIDNNRGKDSNAGTSRSQAWRNLSKLEGLSWKPGDEVMLADDSEWYLDKRVTLRDCNGTADRPIVFSRFSPSGDTSSSFPVLRARYQPAAKDWTFDPAVGAWYIAEPNGAPLADVQGFGVVLLGPEKRHGMFVRRFRDPNTALKKSMQWSVDPVRKRYYLNAPKDTNPSDFYGGVVLGIPADAQPALLFLRCGSHVHVRNLKFQECGNGVKVGLYTGATTDIAGFQMTSCVGYNIGSLISMGADYSPGRFEHVVSSAKIDGNRIERCATAGIRLVNTADIDVTNNIGDDATGRSWAIGFVYVDSDNDHPRTGGGRVLGNRFSRARHGTDYTESDNDFDGAAIYCEAGSRRVEVRGNVVTDCHTAFQDNGGRGPGNLWVSNIAYRCGRGIVITDADGIGTGALRFLNNVCVLTGGTTLMPSAAGLKGAIRVGAYFSGKRHDSCIIANNILFSMTPGAFGVQIDSKLKSTIENNIVSGFRIPLSDRSGVAVAMSETNSTTDPLFLDVNNPERGLRPDTPASKAGMSFDGLLDVTSMPYTEPINIGAWASISP
jgi:hypothetical protein